jgi:hypothetical protein
LARRWCDGDARGRRARRRRWSPIRSSAARRTWFDSNSCLWTLGFYRSNDLVAWSPDPDLSKDVRAASGYALAIHNGAVWLATPMPGEPPGVKLLRFDLEAAVRSVSERVWLFPEPGSPAPLLVFTGPDLTLERRRP